MEGLIKGNRWRLQKNKKAIRIGQQSQQSKQSTTQERLQNEDIKTSVMHQH